MTCNKPRAKHAIALLMNCHCRNSAIRQADKVAVNMGGYLPDQTVFVALVAAQSPLLPMSHVARLLEAHTTPHLAFLLLIWPITHGNSPGLVVYRVAKYIESKKEDRGMAGRNLQFVRKYCAVSADW